MIRSLRLRSRAALHLATVVAGLCLATPALANAPLENIAPRSHRAPAGATLDDIRTSIVQAANELGWQLGESDPDRVRVSIIDGDRREATVDIRFDEGTFAIDYVDSVDLDYTETGIGAAKRSQKSSLRRLTTEQTFDLAPRIHENYNQWVASLADRVEQRIAKPRPIRPRTTASDEAAADAVDTSPTLIADELEKLDALRQRGVLTDAEFEAQKKKLLSH